MKKLFILISAMFYLVIGTNANNLTITNVSVSGNQITFTVAWQNSWNSVGIALTPQNYDAAWVFIKYQICAPLATPPSPWNHVMLTAALPVISVTTPQLTATLSSDLEGVFIYPSTNGTWANMPASGTCTVTLTMSFTDAGYNYQVFGIEMVDIPTGAFYVGDGSSSNTLGSCIAPVQITSNNAQTVDGWCTAYALPATYPMGYNQFYMMKYEISQDQYVGFLNTLTYNQQVNLTYPGAIPSSPPYTPVMGNSALVVNRNAIEIKTSGVFNGTPAIYGNDMTSNLAGMNAATDGQWIACNWMNWDDLASYLAWAGLRPMTEMEFEKACRGTLAPVTNEYPWGTVPITAANSGALTNANTATEVPTVPGNGECAEGVGSTALGPLRVGFAATAATARTQAGAGYYGVMDLAGNVMEQTVPVYWTTFTNGTVNPPALSAAGFATYNTAPLFWPTYVNTLGRGGDFYDPVNMCKTSDRTYALAGTEGYTYFQNRNYKAGGRGVRMP